MFGDGGVVNASFGDHVGLKALLEILDIPKGRYEFSADIEFAEENLKLSIRKELGRVDDEMTRRWKSERTLRDGE